jgi:hypothetical protein
MKTIKSLEEYNSLGKTPSIVEFGTPDTCIPCKYTQENLKKFEEDKKFDLTFYECSDINIISSLEYSAVPVVVLVTPSKKVELTDSSVSMDEDELASWIEQNIGD